MSLETPSQYLVDAQRRAETTSEAEFRQAKIAALSQAREAEFRASMAQAEERIAEEGWRAFIGAAGMRTETQRLLFEARSYVQLLNQRELLSRAGFDELLLAECTHLCGGDDLKARLLASAVLGI